MEQHTSKEGNMTPAQGQDFDLVSAMEWRDGIATLPGSNLKFRMTEFNTLEIITDAEIENKKDNLLKAGSRAAPLKGLQDEDEPSMDGIYCCENCGQYGTIENFSHMGRFCSETCANKHKERYVLLHPSFAVSVPAPYSLQRRYITFSELLEDIKVKPKGAQDHQTRGRRAPKLLKQALAVPGKKKAWNWASYLEEERTQAAPIKLFKECQSFPQSRNGFKVGMRLEGIDPEHPSMFCVLSVAEVQGYRIRLHFDGYSECYDFWLNADSPDIHPYGWCEKTSRKLHLPKGYKDSASYLKSCKAQAASKTLFKSLNTPITPSGFRVGMKLEAVDKKNPSLICVSTIADMVDNRLLIHFDNWDDGYDYWCDASSPYIRPVGSCQKLGLTLTTPPEYKDSKAFVWEKYLEVAGSQAAPARAFKLRPLHGFQLNMKLEAVDKRNPMLIRAATVVDTEDHRIKIHLDGWSHDYDYWLDSDSPDIHPIGWCAKTGHPLQTPLSPADLVTPVQGGCPTPGCKGIGHIKGARYAAHYTLISCPYSEINLNKETVLPDRLSGERQSPVSGAQKLRKIGAETPGSATPEPPEESPQLNPLNKICRSIPWAGRPPKYLKLQIVKEEEGRLSRLQETPDSDPSLQQALHQSVFMSSVSPLPTQHRLQLRWEQHSKLLPEVAGHTARRVAKWSVEEVAIFVQSLPGCKDQALVFREEQIDGEAFLLLTQMDMVKILSIKLGPALKIYNSIVMFKNAEENESNVY
uniref:Lethal(3)malignant brain tumor-like protein 4 n=2 Tax=Callorhinchus milii TaxID=7868 RepID=A0A4W3K864_CALMI